MANLGSVDWASMRNAVEYAPGEKVEPEKPRLVSTFWRFLDRLLTIWSIPMISPFFLSGETSQESSNRGRNIFWRGVSADVSMKM